jgi:hypothetical protein
LPPHFFRVTLSESLESADHALVFFLVRLTLSPVSCVSSLRSRHPGGPQLSGDTMNPFHALAAACLAASSLSVHAVGQLAEISLYDRANAREMPVHWHEGRAYVAGKPGSEYQVVVRNRGGEELLAVVSVDGVNVMNGETASPRQSGYVIAPWGRLEVRGWRKSLDETAAFYFTSLGDSYAARTDRPANVGVIGVALFKARRQEPSPYAQAAPAPAPQSSGATAKSEAQDALRNRASQEAPQAMAIPATPLGTGHGRREESPMRWVQFERATSEPAETLAIYYDSQRNLVARGILQSPAGPRDPEPFPTAFVPDPVRRW